jgi:hypothetical protein
LGRSHDDLGLTGKNDRRTYGTEAVIVGPLCSCKLRLRRASPTVGLLSHQRALLGLHGIAAVQKAISISDLNLETLHQRKHWPAGIVGKGSGFPFVRHEQKSGVCR